MYDSYPAVTLRNVAEPVDTEWTDEGAELRRVPAAVADGIGSTCGRC